MLKPAFITSVLITLPLTITPPASIAAVNNGDYLDTVPRPVLQSGSNNNSNSNNSSNKSFNFSDFIKGANGTIDNFEGFISGGIDLIGGNVGSFVSQILGATSPIGNFINDLTGLANLVFRVMQLPSSLSGWWEQLVGVIDGELDPCLSSPDISTTPPIVFEPGWCIGTSTGGGNSGGNSVDPDNEEVAIDPQTGQPLPGGGNPNNPSGGNSPGGNPNGNSSNPNNSGAGPSMMSQILKDAQGPAGIPDPSEVRWRIARANVDKVQFGDAFEPNSEVGAHYLGNTGERAVSRLNAYSVLSKPGQKKLQWEAEGLQDAVKVSYGTAKDAQMMDVTQDIVKQGVQVQAHTNLLLGSLATSNQQQRIDNALNNLMLNNISRTLDESQRSDRIERAIASQKVFSLMSQASLY